MFKTMLADSHDIESVSSKRVITLIAFILCTIAFLANLFFDYKLDPMFLDAMVYIIVAGFGMTGIEKFASSKSTNQNTQSNRWDNDKVDFHP
jgi:hypothetical protein